MPEFLGVVVLYHPDDDVAGRVRTYLDEVSTLLVIDNSEQSSPIVEKIQSLGTKIKVLGNRTNPGIAFALNQAVDIGLANGFDWLLTMDQDSFFEEGAIARMKDLIISLNPVPAIITPLHVTQDTRLPGTNALSTDVRVAMTSGNLLNLMAARQSGPFEEKLFIDSVDHEYCLRLRRRGYRVTRANHAVLHHRLGEVKRHRLLFWKIKSTSRSSRRQYYMTRNRLYVAKRYFAFDPLTSWYELSGVVKNFVRIALFEREKKSQLSAVLRGAWHFLKGQYGKYSGESPMH